MSKKAKKKTEEIICQFDTNNLDLDNVDVKQNPIQVPEMASHPAKPVPAGKSSARQEVKNEDGEQLNIPNELGILALRNAVVFPGTVIPLAVGRSRSNRLLDDSLQNEKLIGVITQKNPNADEPEFHEIYPVGTVVSIIKTLKLPDGQRSIVVHGLVRFRVVQWLGKDPFLRARIEVLTSQVKPSKELAALANSIRQMAEHMIKLSPNIPEEVNVVLTNIEDPGALADFLAANINIAVDQKQKLLETADVGERLKILSVAMASQNELLELSAKIQHQVSKSIDKTQREYFLQEQLKAIQSELGQSDQKSAEMEELKGLIEKAQMPEKVRAEAQRELDRLSRMHTMSPEFSVQRSYIEWLCELPWAKSTEDKLNLSRARQVLNTDHYDLVKVKKRILEFLAVRKLNPEGRSPILCFVGPPGVGKTSLGKSIARSLGRKFVRISLGGIRDEADIRGHRRTYIGALPGRIIQELRKCESRNPVFMLDELDKIGQDFRGDPASALLEVLDPEQNNSFTDHYIGQPFDLSKVMFIGTANYMGTVPPALRDRMEVIELPGYTASEKLSIAKQYLLPRQLQENGLTGRQLLLKDGTLEKIIESYTREAGVRELERQIAAVCRAIAVEIAEGKRKTAAVSPSLLASLLGPVQYESELALRTSTPGVATGLAYTPVGGEVLFIESSITPGEGHLVLTGQLGDVMKESAQAAVTVIKSLAAKKIAGKNQTTQKILAQFLVDHQNLKKHNIHIHVPAGAIPKDGPSAGLAIYTSLVSLFTGRAVRADLAMTGEITLRGLVLPIGGVKEKVLAAKRAGIKTVILPDRNKKDTLDLPKDALRNLTFVFVDHVDKVLRIALEN